MASKVYPIGLAAALNGEFAVDTGIKAALVTTSYTYSNAHNFYDDVSANVVGTPIAVSGEGATASGDTVTIDCADTGLTWTSVAAGSTIGYVLFYYDSGTPSTSNLLAISDVTDTATNGGDITVTIHASGIATIAT
jgi:hypothetical protein